MVKRAEGPLETVGWGPFALFGERKRLREAERKRMEELNALSGAEAAAQVAEALPQQRTSAIDLISTTDQLHGRPDLAEMKARIWRALQESFTTGTTSIFEQGSRSVKVSYWGPQLYTTNYDSLLDAVIPAVARDEEAVMLLHGSTVVVKHRDELRAATLDATTAARFASTPELMKDPEAALAELDRIAVNDP